MHLDCIVHDGVPHVIELNPRIAGSFICDIVRDGYGFNVVEAFTQARLTPTENT